MLTVEWIDPKDLEVQAEKVLRKYGQEVRPVVAPPVPVENIIEGFLGLELELDDLNPEDVNRDNLGWLFIKEGRVVVDSKLENEEGRYHFTLAHEVGHWVLHKGIVLAQENQLSLLGEGKQPSIICRRSQKRKPAEWQADCFAAALMMPRAMVMDVLRQESRPETAWIYDYETKALWGLEKKDYFRSVASMYNKRFGVSIQAMQIRLEQLDLLREEANVRLL